MTQTMRAPLSSLNHEDIMAIWRECLTYKAPSDPMEAVISELAAYFKLPIEEARRRCYNWEEESVAQWHSADRSTPESVVEFFQTQTSWIFDTMRYHAEQYNGTVFPESVEVAYRFRDLKPGKHLDFGAGPGTSSLLFHELGWQVALADISTSFLDFARWRLKRHDVSADFYNTATDRLPKESFDLITALDVVVHIPDVRSALMEIHHALKPGGYFVFNIDSRPRGPTTEYHFFEDHYPIIGQMRGLGFSRKPNIDFIYVYQKTERSPSQQALITIGDKLLYNKYTHNSLARSAKNGLRKLLRRG